MGLCMRLACIALAFKEELLAPVGKPVPGRDLGCGFNRGWKHILRALSSTYVQLLAGKLGNFCV